MPQIKSLLVFCGSSLGVDPRYATIAKELGTYLGENNIRLIFGGGKVGLMGTISNAVLDVGGEAVGIMPSFLGYRERANQRVTEFIEVETMHERKYEMLKRADAVVALPGGFGTLDELFEALTWSQLGLHQKPLGLLNFDGYFDPLLLLNKKMVEAGFLQKQNMDLLIVHRDFRNLISELEKYQWTGEAKWAVNGTRLGLS